MEPLGPLTESLDTEIKNWINLDIPHDAALLAKACIAIRNHGGGRVILGVDNKTLASLKPNRPADLATAYHPDKLQSIIRQFALPPFEVKLTFKEYCGEPHPEISITGGIEYPVITKAPFEKQLLQNVVYARSISDGRPASCQPRTPNDWDVLIRECFDNREANIGRFFNRHLAGILTEFQKRGLVGERVIPACDEVTVFRHFGRTQFEKERERRPEEKTRQQAGFIEVALLVQGDFEPPLLAHLLDKVFMHQPHLTGWPAWVDSRGFSETARPYIASGGWETFVHRVAAYWAEESTDFWRMEPKGNFYLLRTFEDDTALSLRKNGVQPGTLFDFYLLISRTTEILVTGKAFAEGLSASAPDTTLEFSFHWSGLRGREICSWIAPARGLITKVRARDDEVTSACKIQIDIADAALWPFVKQLTQPVFDIFGAGVGDDIFQEIADRTLKREQ